MSHPIIRRAIVILACAAPASLAQYDVVNWENPHVHPMDITPDNNTLLAVNTADNRLEIFDITSGTAVPTGAVPVGLDPVSVRARDNATAWVVNHISDSVSIVDLTTQHVILTLSTLDEPTDVVFAGPQRAFVSCSQVNTVLVFDLNDLTLAPQELAIAGEEPRAMAVSPSGDTVYVAVFESGNRTTILGGGLTMAAGYPPNVVNDPAGPYGGVNPPPNDGAAFDPPQNGANPAPPAVGLIVRNDGNAWVDDNNGDWTALVSGADAALSGRPVGWDLPDHDVAVIDADTLAVSYIDHLMNLCMHLAVNPATDDIAVVGTEATNEIRFEPNLSGRFIRVNVAVVDDAAPGSPSIVDLNDHLTYATSFVPQNERDMSIGDPRGIAFNAAGTRAYVTGMGSNNVVVLDAAGGRAGLQPTIEVGEGPTGVVLDEARERLYVINKFEAAISVVDLVGETELDRVPFFDPSPTAIKVGRKHLYDTHKNSGLGHTSCAACHIDARIDRLSWDLGDPAGDMKAFNQNCNNGVAPACQDWHPMKGPMTTQTLQDIIGKEPHHWRGDRDGIEEFNGAFESLLGDDAMLSPAEMQEFEDFLATIAFPPNPFRNFDNSLPTDLALTGHFTPGRFAPEGLPLPNGDAVNGLSLYRNAGLDGVDCVSCHTLPTGVGSNYTLVGISFQPMAPGPNGELHHSLVSVDGSTNISIKTPQLRNLYDKVGFEATQSSNLAGFGFLHDGSVDSIARFIAEPAFSVGSDQDIADLVAFMLAFSGSDLPTGSATDPTELPGPPSSDAHAAVGMQTTLVDPNAAPAAQLQLIDDMIALAEADVVGLVVKGHQAGEARGYVHVGSMFQSDRSAESLTPAALQAGAAPGSELTYTLVPAGSEIRIGIDRDGDGFFDQDEIDGCSDPADAASTPPLCPLECTTFVECADGDGNGIRDDGCQWWACDAGTCVGTAVAFADMGGQFGACPPDGSADGNDRFHALNCFANMDPDGSAYSCEPGPPAAFNVDAGGPFGDCAPDGVCDGNDAFHALNAFDGTTSCSCPLDGGPQPLAPSPKITARARLALNASTPRLRPGQFVEIDVILTTALLDLRGYQLHLSSAGGKTGELELVDILVRQPAPKSRAVPFEDGSWSAFNAHTHQMVAGTDGPGVEVPAGAYLATFVYRAAHNAHGRFVIDAMHDRNDSTHRSFLFPTAAHARIEIERSAPAIIDVDGRTR